jgi:hypothetical protein
MGARPSSKLFSAEGGVEYLRRIAKSEPGHSCPTEKKLDELREAYSSSAVARFNVF